MQKSIDYKEIMRTASLNAIRGILTEVSKNGLPGQHHFYITFDMTNPSVKISDGLRERYPTEMTIVLQNWYKDLIVTDKIFSITLNFSNIPEKMVIPFESIRSFVDPSVEFGLEFDQISPKERNLEIEAPQINYKTEVDTSKREEDAKKSSKKTGEVVNIENFRKP